ncbi:Metal cation symporter ZIP14 [Pseudolycoriella hygida]|uniref:Metal cation symporter ZIP14 n=1 Tax=Pseudolycoriella hygida TaxID=35572 RepID=A0A9Q0S9E4_9DIPT|nr:Metal cation symporter ZIP14 [Pseudolycoriella hygida]
MFIEVLKKPNRFLAHIFNKYGSHGVINFEGLEHFMHNLGLGDLEFDPGHTVDQHRPDGFKVPDIVVDDENTESIKQTTDASIDIKFKETTTLADPKDHVETNGKKRSPNETAPAEYLNTITWKSGDWEDTSFASLHNPKHVHHRPHAHDKGGISSLHKSCLSPTSMLRVVVNDQRTNDGRNELNYRVDPDNKKVNHRHRRSSNSDEHSEEAEADDEFIANIKITPTMFLNMCPALLVQIEQGACSEVTKIELGKQDKAFTMAWIYATVSIVIISLCGLVGIAIVPLTKSIAYDEILRFLIALAVGTLCGDALMHLLPHSLTPHRDHGNVPPLFVNGSAENDPVWLCCCAFMSALFMYSLEVLLPLLNGGRTHSHNHGHSRNPANTAKYVIRDEDIEIAEITAPKPTEQNKELKQMLDDSKIQKKSALSPVAFMVVLGDGLHNLTDGMAIGAAFGMDPVTGMATAFAVLCHELPHELGDFALLLQTGVSIKRAIFLNLISSVLSVIGMIVGLVIAGVHTGFVRWIYAGTAGTFLYIALADLVPELGRNEKTLKNAILQISGILTGGVVMLAIALNEDRLRFLFE